MPTYAGKARHEALMSKFNGENLPTITIVPLARDSGATWLRAFTVHEGATIAQIEVLAETPAVAIASLRQLANMLATQSGGLVLVDA